MLKIGIVGLGFMGSTHLTQYKRMESENFPIKVVAICDVDEKKHKGEIVAGNLAVTEESTDFSAITFYSDMAEMIEQEALDYVDICLPTYLHANYSIQAMELGVHVFCEKPMALTVDECQRMIDTSKQTGKYLMIGQTLRFFPRYQYVKESIDHKTFGELTELTLFRGGTTPFWSWENWLLTREKSGGCLLDQHIHDVDTINWYLGTPEKVSATGKIVYENSGYDIVSSNYSFAGKVVNAQDNWTINNDDFGFEMRFRASFEKGTIIMENDKLITYPNGEAAFEPTISAENGYYLELKHFAQSILDGVDPAQGAPLASCMETVRIAKAEEQSIDQQTPVNL